MEWSVWALGGVVVIAVATFSLGVWGSRTARTTTDFLVARRLVGEEQNAAAISGEYLSAASFLGVAGLVLKDGVDALWYPIGFTAGYLGLMLFVAAPMRRSGAYTLPDFTEARLDSLRLRRLATALVVLIGWLYLVPQLQAAGLTLSAISARPYWVGVLAVAVIVLVSVLSGGMRAVTLVQAFQYWVKLFAISVPAFLLFAVFLTSAESEHRRALDAPSPPVFERDTTVDITTDARLRISEPMWVEVAGSGAYYQQPGAFSVAEGTQLRFPAGASVPTALDAESDNASWLRPQDTGIGGLLHTYSLITATFLGTMGLPHVLARFYSNPNGQAARRTTLFVLLLLGGFYLFPTIFGMLGRFYVPQLLVTGTTDAAVLLLPSTMSGGWIGGVLTSITAAGAFAAFLSTSSGLVVTIAGVLSTDVLRSRVNGFRVVSVLAALVPTALALMVDGQDLSQSVGLAFAMAASTFAPLLILGIWWRGLTAVGAASGMIVGACLVLLAIVLGALDGPAETPLSLLLDQPAILTVPAAFTTAVLVSRMTRNQVPRGIARIMLRMHVPDRLGFTQDRRAGAEQRRSSGRHRLR